MNPYYIRLVEAFAAYRRSLMSPQRLQMLQHSQVRIHKPLNTIRHARLLLAGQLAGRYRAGDTFLETRLGQIVNSCEFKKLALSFEHHSEHRARGRRTLLHLTFLPLVREELLQLF